MSTKKTAEPPQQKTRNKLGQFVAGNKSSKGAGGRPKLREEFKNLALELSVEALMVVKEIMTNPTSKAGDRAYCARLIMEYGYGRPSLEYDREKLELDKRLTEAQIRKLEHETEDDKAVSVTVAFDAVTEASGWAK